VLCVTKRYNVLFLCTGNSARSIIAETLLNELGKGRFHAYSAGSRPNGEVNPLALSVLDRHRLPIAGLRSKSWDEFAKPGAPTMDAIVTVCDRAAQETCPIWPGAPAQPLTAHWGIADPAAVQGSEVEKVRAFDRAFRELESRIKMFTSLKLDTLDRPSLKRELDGIGESVTPEA
jgi:arsenate reductase